MAKTKKSLGKLSELIANHQELVEFRKKIGKAGWEISLSVCNENECHTVMLDSVFCSAFLKDLEFESAEKLKAFGIDVSAFS